MTRTCRYVAAWPGADILSLVDRKARRPPRRPWGDKPLFSLVPRRTTMVLLGWRAQELAAFRSRLRQHSLAQMEEKWNGWFLLPWSRLLPLVQLWRRRPAKVEPLEKTAELLLVRPRPVSWRSARLTPAKAKQSVKMASRFTVLQKTASWKNVRRTRESLRGKRPLGESWKL